MKSLSILLMVLLGFLSPSFGQESEKERRTRQFSEYYENLVNQSLARYYHSTSFVVDARVILAEKSQEIPDSMAAVLQPALEPPSQQESGNAFRNPDGLEALPGLPVLPDHMRTDAKPHFDLTPVKASSPAPNPVVRTDLGIQYIDVNVLVDTLYSAADVEFIMELVAVVSKMDEGRGDRVFVRKIPFPRVNRELLAEHRIRTDSTPHPVDTVKMDTVAPVAVHPWNAYWEQLPSLLPLLLILVFLTVIVALVVKGLRSAQIPPELMRHLETTRVPVVAPALTADPVKPMPPLPEAEDQAKFDMQRTSCLNALIGDPMGGAMLLKNWIEADRSKGLRDTAVFIESLDTKVLEILRPHLLPQDIKAIQLQLDVQDMPPLEERTSLLHTFHKELRNLRSRSTDGTIADIFGFLHQLSTPQLLHILKDEPVGIVGLALAQIPGERAGLILQQMEQDFRTQVLVAMGQIDTIPVQAYKEVANRLSRKALEVGNMRFVAADGVQTVLDIVQGLGLAEQVEYLRSIAERDLNLAGRLRRFYASFDELPSLPEALLVKVLNTFDRELLVSALVDTDEEFREKLLQSMPQRFRMAVNSGLESKVDQSPLETERTRKALLTLVRQELQSSGGRQ